MRDNTELPITVADISEIAASLLVVEERVRQALLLIEKITGVSVDSARTSVRKDFATSATRAETSQ